MRYTVVFDRTERNYGAYVPHLPIVVVTGRTLVELATNARWQLAEALRMDKRYDDALQVLDQALLWQRQGGLPEGHPQVVQTRQRRVDLLRRSDRKLEALSEAESVVGALHWHFIS